MRALLMHPDRDFDLEQPLPLHDDALMQDLEIGTLLKAMGHERVFRPVVQAELKDGLLTLTVPKAREAQPKRIAIIAIAVDHSHARIGTGKNRSENDGEPRQPATANKMDRTKLRSQEKTKRGDNWKNSIHPFRWNQRHHCDSADDPGNEKEHLRRKPGQPFSGRRFRLSQRHHE